MKEIAAKLEMLVSGYKINEDDAIWLRAILAKPAEAEGVAVAGFLYKNNGQALTAADMDADTFALMARSDFDGEVEKLVRQDDHLAALAAVTAERDAARRECEENEGAMQVWRRRTTQAEREIDQLRAEVEALRKDKERLAWMFDEECNVRGYLAQDRVRYGVVWPDLGESQAELFADPRAAIDAALAAKDDSACQSSRPSGCAATYSLSSTLIRRWVALRCARMSSIPRQARTSLPGSMTPGSKVSQPSRS